MVQFACFPGHYASFKTPDLHHQKCHLHRSHLDLGYLLFTPACYLPEIIYLQVQVRSTSREQPGGSEDFGRGEWSPLSISELPVPDARAVLDASLTFSFLHFFCFFSSFFLNNFSFLLILWPVGLQGQGSID